MVHGDFIPISMPEEEVVEEIVKGIATWNQVLDFFKGLSDGELTELVAMIKVPAYRCKKRWEESDGTSIAKAIRIQPCCTLGASHLGPGSLMSPSRARGQEFRIGNTEDVVFRVEDFRPLFEEHPEWTMASVDPNQIQPGEQNSHIVERTHNGEPSVDAYIAVAKSNQTNEYEERYLMAVVLKHRGMTNAEIYGELRPGQDIERKASTVNKWVNKGEKLAAELGLEKLNLPNRKEDSDQVEFPTHV